MPLIGAERRLTVNGPAQARLARRPLSEQVTRLAAAARALEESTITKNDDDDDATAELVQARARAEAVLAYYDTVGAVLKGLAAADDVEWVCAGRGAISRVRELVAETPNVVEEVMSTIETVERTDANSAECHAIADLIQTAVQRWTEIVDMTESVRAQIEVAGEWRELHEGVLGALEDELEECADIAFALHEARFAEDAGEPDGWDVTGQDSDKSHASSVIGLVERAQLLADVLCKSVDSDGTPATSTAEKRIDARFTEVTARLRPLQASLEFLHVRIDAFAARANDWFPSSVEALRAKRQACEDRLAEVSADVDALRDAAAADRRGTAVAKAVRTGGALVDVLEREIGNEDNRRAHHRIAAVLALERLLDAFDAIANADVIVDTDTDLVALRQRWRLVRDREVAESEAHSPAMLNVTLRGNRSHVKSDSTASSVTAVESPPTSAEHSPVLKAGWLASAQLDAGPLSLTPIRGLAARRSSSASHVGGRDWAPAPIRSGPRRSLIPVVSPAKRPTTSIAPVTVHASRPSTTRRPSSRVDHVPALASTPSKIPRPSSGLDYAHPSPVGRLQAQFATPRRLNRKVSMPSRLGLSSGPNHGPVPDSPALGRRATSGFQTPTLQSPRKSSLPVRNAPTPRLRPSSRLDDRPPWR